MSKKDKLKERFKKLPNDFSFDELVRLFASVGFMLTMYIAFIDHILKIL